MAVRLIDANELLKKFAYSPADTEDEQVFNAAARKIIRGMPTLTPPNEALTCERCVDYKRSSMCMCKFCTRNIELRDYYRRPPEGGDADHA